MSLKMNNEILKLKHVRYRFANLFTPKSPVVSGAPRPRYDITLLIENGSANDKLIQDGIMAIANCRWQGDVQKAKNWINALRAQDRIQYRDGETKADKFPEFAGMHILTATRAESQGPPVVRDRDGKTPLTATDGRPYAGCLVDVILELYAASKTSKGGERISCAITAVQFVKDGEMFPGQGYQPNDTDFTSYEASPPPD